MILMIKTLENQHGCCGKKVQKWEDQSMGDGDALDQGGGGGDGAKQIYMKNAMKMKSGIESQG